MLENNKAIITKINVVPHPNADRLQLGYCFGNQLIVGLETKDGDIGIFFSTGLQLSKEYAIANDLIRRKDKDGNPAGGMFDDNRKVRCQKFRGEKSEGYFAPLSSLEVLGIDISKLKENDCFDSLNGIPICNKFISESTYRRIMSIGKSQAKKTRGETQFFKQHFDTAQWRLNKGEFKAGDLITISLKLHGCVSGDTLVDTLEYGLLAIKTIVDNKLPVKIKSYNHFIEEIVYVDIDDYFYLKDDGEWYEIELEDGKKIQITENNPVYLPDLKIYRQVKDLKIGDNILSD